MKLLKYRIGFTEFPRADEELCDPWEDEITLSAFNIVEAAKRATEMLKGREMHIHTVKEE